MMQNYRDVGLEYCPTLLNELNLRVIFGCYAIEIRHESLQLPLFLATFVDI